MILILTMAGRYTRFANEGFKAPKYLLPWGDRTILSTILSELLKDKNFTEVILVANLRDEAYMPHVKHVMRNHGIPENHLILTVDTGGQAETAHIGVLAAKSLLGNKSLPVVFHNIDTILLDRNTSILKTHLLQSRGFIDVFHSNNSDYSYVLTDDKNQVNEIAEKMVVSNLATSGLYGFDSLDTFEQFYHVDDIYISNVYKRMVSSGEVVRVGPTCSEKNTIVLGTPNEYMTASLLRLS